ncbi:helix-turn-helix domain-containing protein [Aeromicrobium endophyticum]|uniref:PucR family transcriptional regulator n=1 Tax=Aeromicrobium endophyticum TaxID=2292704 RepID=A0A371NZ08_9ACTN|nr:PucR family transcriptional regulator [Aeromicrobium endophyticum]REK68925.1 PucR family transcriptional regulator [Aeromicrobium endophyticum]
MGRLERAAVQQRLTDDREVVTERISAAIREQIPAYASLGETQRRETEAIVTWGVRRLLELWVTDTSLDEADLQRFRGIGAARGTDGRPLFAVLRAYRVAGVETSGLIGEAAADLTIDDALSLNRVMLASLDQLSEALFAGYTSATERLAADRAQVVRDLADDLVTGRQTSAAALKDRSAQLGITLPAALSITVVGSVAGEVTVGEVDGLAAAVAESSDEVLVLSTCRAGQGVLLHSGPIDLTATGQTAARRTCTVADVPLADLPATCTLAATAVRHAPAAAFAGRSLDEADALLVALLRGEPAVDPRTFASAALHPLLGRGQAHLLQGLDAYLSAGSSVEAGRALGLHAQSMRYRLRRARELTGRDLDSPWDHQLLRTACTIRGMDLE